MSFLEVPVASGEEAEAAHAAFVATGLNKLAAITRYLIERNAIAERTKEAA